MLLKKNTEEQRGKPCLVRLVSLGCPKNTVDTGVAAGALLVDGFGLTADDDEADVVWINTCAFLLSARKEAMAEIRRASPALCKIILCNSERHCNKTKRNSVVSKCI